MAMHVESLSEDVVGGFEWNSLRCQPLHVLAATVRIEEVESGLNHRLEAEKAVQS